jgi:hypothetical protein
MNKIILSVDRIEGDIAVLATGSSGKNYTAQKAQWPKGLKEGDWVIAELDGEKVMSIQIDPEAKKAAESRIADKLALLRSRSKGK